MSKPAKDTFIRLYTLLTFAIPPFICFIRLLLLAPFFTSMPVRCCLEEKCRKEISIVGLPAGSPEDIYTPEENEMFFYGQYYTLSLQSG